MPQTLGPDGQAWQTVSQARLSSVLDTAVDGILVIDESATILVYNRACERLFGYRPEQTLGQNVRMIMPDEYGDRHDTYMSNYMSSGVRKIIGIGREVRARHADGTEFAVELSVGEAKTPDGRQFVGIIRDLRPRKEAERRVNELQADLLHMARVSAMDEMGAALAHELNQPLTAIMLYLQAAVRAVRKARDASEWPDDAFQSVLNKAVHEAERAGNIISRMRQFVEKREPQRREVNLNAVVDEAAELTLLGLRSPVRATRRYADNLPAAIVDPVQIQQIVVNLIRNALEAVKDRPEAAIVIETAREGESLVVSISDNGPGISAAVLPTLFKAFSTSKRTGMGLGLSISRTIAQNHGGDLAVDPGGQGEGACFRLLLPVLHPGSAAPEDSPVDDVPTDGAAGGSRRARDEKTLRDKAPA
jgi:two-component system, LuxR family, sensor kinase FixL